MFLQAQEDNPRDDLTTLLQKTKTVSKCERHSMFRVPFFFVDRDSKTGYGRIFNSSQMVSEKLAD